jgi:glycerol-3-phosphate acyltransferase PlsY
MIPTPNATTTYEAALEKFNQSIYQMGVNRAIQWLPMFIALLCVVSLMIFLTLFIIWRNRKAIKRLLDL